MAKIKNTVLKGITFDNGGSFYQDLVIIEQKVLNFYNKLLFSQNSQNSIILIQNLLKR